MFERLIFFLIQSILKWVVLLKKFFNLLSMIFAPRKLCKMNTAGVRADIITAGLGRTCSVLKFYTVGVASSLSLYVLIPMKFLLIDNVFMPLLPLETPFCDQKTIVGFTITFLFHSAVGIFGMVAVIM